MIKKYIRSNPTVVYTVDSCPTHHVIKWGRTFYPPVLFNDVKNIIEREGIYVQLYIPSCVKMRVKYTRSGKHVSAKLTWKSFYFQHNDSWGCEKFMEVTSPVIATWHTGLQRKDKEWVWDARIFCAPQNQIVIPKKETFFGDYRGYVNRDAMIYALLQEINYWRRKEKLEIDYPPLDDLSPMV